MTLRTALLFALFWACGASAAEANIIELRCRYLPAPEQTLVRACDLLVPSPEGLKSEVFVKAWVPEKPVGVVVFLHGRGYTRLPEELGSMIEDMGLEKYLASESYRARPHLVLAPQDNFVQSDTGNRGQDYWVGADGRDWIRFLVDELPTSVASHFGVSAMGWKSMGVSMGAHGAMKVALTNSRRYTKFASISPVFRATLDEQDPGDFDVFTREGREIVNSIGHALLTGQGIPSRLPPHFIRINAYDSFLGLPTSPMVWSRLKELSGGRDSSVEITGETDYGQHGGHSMGYWRRMLAPAMDWLIGASAG